MSKRSRILTLLSLLTLLLAGCGGGGTAGSGNPGGSSPTISGVAAAGSPLSGTVFLKDASVPARERSAPIAADGSYALDLAGLTPPFLLKAVGSSNGSIRTLYSFAPASGVANINPLSHLAVVEASESDDLTGLYSAPGPVRMQAILAALPQAVARVRAALLPTLAKFGAAGVDFIAGPFVADHQGLDLLLDMTDISAANGLVTIVDKPASRTVQLPRDSFMSSSLDIIDLPTATVGTVIALPGAVAVGPGKSVNLSAVVIGAADQGVVWSVAEEGGGIVTGSGAYTAPATPGTYHVLAVSVADGAKSATVTVTVRRTTSLNIVYSGSGVYSVQAEGFAGVAGMDLTVIYDTATLTNPRVAKGALAGSTLAVANTAVPGMIRWGAISAQEISGSGELATITFDLLGSSPGRIFSMSAALVDNNGNKLAASVSVVSPDGTKTPSPTVSTSGASPNPAGGGGTTVPASPASPQIGTTSSQPVTIVSQPDGSGG